MNFAQNKNIILVRFLTAGIVFSKADVVLSSRETCYYNLLSAVR